MVEVGLQERTLACCGTIGRAVVSGRDARGESQGRTRSGRSVIEHVAPNPEYLYLTVPHSSRRLTGILYLGLAPCDIEKMARSMGGYL